MDVAAAMVVDGAAHGTVIVADHQTAGRGRRGRSWESPPGAGLYFSYISRPSVAANASLSLLTLAAGVGVRNGVRAATGLAAHLKWPNDVLAGRRKLGGILAEGTGIGSAGQAVVIGVGVNVRASAYPPDVAVRATSLEGELGRAVDRIELFVEILAALSDCLAVLAQSPGDILGQWRAAAPSAQGSHVEWDGRRGITAGVDEDGALLVQTGHGIERVIAGELEWTLP